MNPARPARPARLDPASRLSLLRLRCEPPCVKWGFDHGLLSVPLEKYRRGPEFETPRKRRSRELMRRLRARRKEAK